MRDDEKTRLRLLHQFEQMQSGLSARESSAEYATRVLLAKVSTRGSTPLLAQVMRGIILVWDEVAEELERLD